MGSPVGVKTNINIVYETGIARCINKGVFDPARRNNIYENSTYKRKFTGCQKFSYL